MRSIFWVFFCVTIFVSNDMYAQHPRDISFTIIDTPPRYPGCKGANVSFLKECFRNNVEKIITENFNFKKFETLLPKGNHRVFVQFRILEDGSYDQLSARTTYKIIENETLEVLSKLPRFEPGIHKGTPRNVLFATAFTVVINEGITVTENKKR